MRTKVRGGGWRHSPPTGLPCNGCGRNVPPAQVLRNRKLGVFDNLCTEHAKDVHARLEQARSAQQAPVTDDHA